MRVIFGENRMQHCLDNAIKFGMNFTKREVGRTIELDFRKEGGKRNKYFENAKENYDGFHLFNMVFCDVKKRVQSGKYVPKEINNDRISVKTICFNPDNILKNLNKPCVAIDINYCYWNTIRKLGIISEKIYIEGLKKDKEWKNARNASIGSLGASVKETVYENGIILNNTIHKRKFNSCRLDAIDYVWEFANEIISQITDGFLMYLTDCFFVTLNVKDKVIELIEKGNYTSKFEYVTFKKIERKNINNKLFYVAWIKDNDPERYKHQFFNESNRLKEL